MPEGAGAGTENPLITALGLSGIHPAFPIERLPAGGAGNEADTGHRLRQARRAAGLVTRRYALTWDLIGGAELQLLREAYRTTRGGAAATRWRHPDDDPVPEVGNEIESSPHYRVLSLEVNGRGAGPAIGVRMELESVGN